MLDRLWPATVTLALWGVLLVIASNLLGTFEALGEKATLPRKLGKGLGVVVLLYGLVLLIGAFGGSEDALQPLGFLRGTAPGGADNHAESSPLTRIKTSADLDAQLARAVAAGQPVMLDFYADWCVSCKELEKYTFPDPGSARGTGQGHHPAGGRHGHGRRRSGADAALWHHRAADHRVLSAPTAANSRPFVSWDS